jgi:hypothetical protein
MPRRFSAALFVGLLACSLLVCHAGLAPQQGRTMHYRISSKGFNVGEMKAVLSPLQQAGGNLVRFESQVDIAANLLLFKVNSSSREDALIGANGTLSYHRKGQDNGKISAVEAVFEDGVFRFKLLDNGVARSVAVPRSSYDFTTMDCPETTMQREGETMEVRLLDMEHAKVVTRRFHWVKSEDLEVAGKRLHCRVVDFSDPVNSCRRWVSCGDGGMVIVRQDGKGSHGSYSLRMTSVSGSPVNLSGCWHPRGPAAV